MNIKELVAGFKADGKTDEEIREALEGIKAEIDAILEPAEKTEEPVEETEETEDAKMERVFGL